MGDGDDEDGEEEEEEEEDEEENKRQVEALAEAIRSRKFVKCPDCGRECPSKKALLKHQECHQRDRPYKCRHCSYRAESLYRLELHTHKHNQERFDCDQCGKSFKWRANLTNHMKIHNGEGLIECDICGRKCLSPSDLERHKDVHLTATPYSCDICGKEFKHKQNLNQHSKLHTGRGLHKCSICHQACTSSSNLRKHMDTHSRKPKYECDVCQQKFKAAAQLRYHKRLHTRENIHICSFCGKCFPILSKLTKHMEAHSESPQHSCQDCGKMYKHERALMRHRQVVHIGTNTYNCKICKKKFPSPSTLQYHMDSHATTANYECEMCGEKFKRVRALRNHRKLHSGMGLRTCEHCGKTFFTPSALATHLESHSNEQHPCPTCGRMFKHPRAVDRHQIEVHETTGSHECPKCGRTYKSRTMLVQHMKLHTGKGLHSCSVCKKKFIKLSELEKHSDVHSTENKYECATCGKKYKHKYDLKVHGKVHTESALKCDDCGKLFATKQQLNFHIVVHTTDTPFRCKICGGRFKYEYSLVKHWKLHLYHGRRKSRRMSSTQNDTDSKQNASDPTEPTLESLPTRPRNSAEPTKVRGWKKYTSMMGKKNNGVVHKNENVSISTASKSRAIAREKSSVIKYGSSSPRQSKPSGRYDRIRNVDGKEPKRRQKSIHSSTPKSKNSSHTDRKGQSKKKSSHHRNDPAECLEENHRTIAHEVPRKSNILNNITNDPDLCHETSANEEPSGSSDCLDVQTIPSHFGFTMTSEEGDMIEEAGSLDGELHVSHHMSELVGESLMLVADSPDNQPRPSLAYRQDQISLDGESSDGESRDGPRQYTILRRRNSDSESEASVYASPRALPIKESTSQRQSPLGNTFKTNGRASPRSDVFLVPRSRAASPVSAACVSPGPTRSKPLSRKPHPPGSRALRVTGSFFNLEGIKQIFKRPSRLVTPHSSDGTCPTGDPNQQSPPDESAGHPPADSNLIQEALQRGKKLFSGPKLIEISPSANSTDDAEVGPSSTASEVHQGAAVSMEAPEVQSSGMEQPESISDTVISSYDNAAQSVLVETSETESQSSAIVASDSITKEPHSEEESLVYIFPSDEYGALEICPANDGNIIQRECDMCTFFKPVWMVPDVCGAVHHSNRELVLEVDRLSDFDIDDVMMVTSPETGQSIFSSEQIRYQADTTQTSDDIHKDCNNTTEGSHLFDSNCRGEISLQYTQERLYKSKIGPKTTRKLMRRGSTTSQQSRIQSSAAGGRSKIRKSSNRSSPHLRISLVDLRLSNPDLLVPQKLCSSMTQSLATGKTACHQTHAENMERVVCDTATVGKPSSSDECMVASDTNMVIHDESSSDCTIVSVEPATQKVKKGDLQHESLNDTGGSKKLKRIPPGFARKSTSLASSKSRAIVSTARQSSSTSQHITPRRSVAKKSTSKSHASGNRSVTRVTKTGTAEHGSSAGVPNDLPTDDTLAKPSTQDDSHKDGASITAQVDSGVTTPENDITCTKDQETTFKGSTDSTPPKVTPLESSPLVPPNKSVARKRTSSHHRKKTHQVTSTGHINVDTSTSTDATCQKHAVNESIGVLPESKKEAVISDKTSEHKLVAKKSTAKVPRRRAVAVKSLGKPPRRRRTVAKKSTGKYVRYGKLIPVEAHDDIKQASAAERGASESVQNTTDPTAATDSEVVTKDGSAEKLVDEVEVADSACSQTVILPSSENRTAADAGITDTSNQRTAVGGISIIANTNVTENTNVVDSASTDIDQGKQNTDGSDVRGDDPDTSGIDDDERIRYPNFTQNEEFESFSTESKELITITFTPSAGKYTRTISLDKSGRKQLNEDAEHSSDLRGNEEASTGILIDGGLTVSDVTVPVCKVIGTISSPHHTTDMDEDSTEMTITKVVSPTASTSSQPQRVSNIITSEGTSDEQICDAQTSEFRVLATSSTTEVVEDAAKTRNSRISGTNATPALSDVPVRESVSHTAASETSATQKEASLSDIGSQLGSVSWCAKYVRECLIILSPKDKPPTKEIGSAGSRDQGRSTLSHSLEGVGRTEMVCAPDMVATPGVSRASSPPAVTMSINPVGSDDSTITTATTTTATSTAAATTTTTTKDRVCAPASKTRAARSSRILKPTRAPPTRLAANRTGNEDENSHFSRRASAARDRSKRRSSEAGHETDAQRLIHNSPSVSNGMQSSGPEMENEVSKTERSKPKCGPVDSGIRGTAATLERSDFVQRVMANVDIALPTSPRHCPTPNVPMTLLGGGQDVDKPSASITTKLSKRRRRGPPVSASRKYVKRRPNRRESTKATYSASSLVRGRGQMGEDEEDGELMEVLRSSRVAARRQTVRKNRYPVRANRGVIDRFDETEIQARVGTNSADASQPKTMPSASSSTQKVSAITTPAVPSTSRRTRSSGKYDLSIDNSNEPLDLSYRAASPGEIDKEGCDSRTSNIPPPVIVLENAEEGTEVPVVTTVQSIYPRSDAELSHQYQHQDAATSSDGYSTVANISISRVESMAEHGANHQGDDAVIKEDPYLPEIASDVLPTLETTTAAGTDDGLVFIPIKQEPHVADVQPTLSHRETINSGSMVPSATSEPSTPGFIHVPVGFKVVGIMAVPDAAVQAYPAQLAL